MFITVTASVPSNLWAWRAWFHPIINTLKHSRSLHKRSIVAFLYSKCQESSKRVAWKKTEQMVFSLISWVWSKEKIRDIPTIDDILYVTYKPNRDLQSDCGCRSSVDIVCDHYPFWMYLLVDILCASKESYEVSEGTRIKKTVIKVLQYKWCRTGHAAQVPMLGLSISINSFR